MASNGACRTCGEEVVVHLELRCRRASRPAARLRWAALASLLLIPMGAAAEDGWHPIIGIWQIVAVASYSEGPARLGFDAQIVFHANWDFHFRDRDRDSPWNYHSAGWTIAGPAIVKVSFPKPLWVSYVILDDGYALFQITGHNTSDHLDSDVFLVRRIA